MSHSVRRSVPSAACSLDTSKLTATVESQCSANWLGSQGVISVTLVMDEFLNRFPEVSDSASGAGFYKGLMTAMITLGAFIGTRNVGFVPR